MKTRRILCLVLALALMFSVLALPAAAEEDAPRSYYHEEKLAYVLKAIGLFHGVSDVNLALDRRPDRAQSLVLMLRFMGLEPSVLSEFGIQPFKDTDTFQWALQYVGYAYRHGLTNGVSATCFDGQGITDARTYLTFILRALGYSDGEDGDFSWKDPVPLARSLGLIPDMVRLDDFRRADVVAISYAALTVNCKGSNVTLAQDLADRGILKQEALDAYFDPNAAKTGTLASPYAENIAQYLQETRVPLGIDISGYSMIYRPNVLQIGDAAYEYYGFYAGGPDACAAQLKAGAAAVAGQARVFAIGAPNRLGAVLSMEDFSRIASSSSKTEAEGVAYLYEQAGDQVIGVDAITNLRLHNNEYIFFRTDHHWTGLGAYYAYQAWAEAAGFEPAPLSDFDAQTREGCLGWFYGLCGNPPVMSQNPDTVVAYIPHSNLTAEYLDYGGWRTDDKIVYNYNNYAAYLLGDHQLVTITNNDIQDDSACLLVKDSYGNPFAVYLTQHYHTVYVIDYRQYCDVQGYLTFSQFAAQKGVQDIIVILPMTMQSGGTADYLYRYCH